MTYKAGVLNEFNTNDKLHKLKIKLLIQSGALIGGKQYDLNFDNEFVPCEKYDSKKVYKMSKGYFHAVASVGEYTVYFENRNGNSNVKYEQDKTLQNTFELLKDNNITIDRARMDCG